MSGLKGQDLLSETSMERQRENLGGYTKCIKKSQSQFDVGRN